jgi:hypothetical protein
MYKIQITYAVVLIFVSLLSLPVFNLLDTIIAIGSGDMSESLFNFKIDVVGANPYMRQLQAEVFEHSTLLHPDMWLYVIWAELLFVSIGGIYVALSIIIYKALPRLLLITICLVFLFSQGAPWDGLLLFKGVNSYNSLITRLELLKEYDSAIRLIFTSCIIGTFYLISAVHCTLQFFRPSKPKIM